MILADASKTFFYPVGVLLERYMVEILQRRNDFLREAAESKA